MAILIERASSLFDSAKSKGADYIDIRYGRVLENFIQIKNNQVVYSSRNVTSGYGIRVLTDGVLSFISVPRISAAEKELQRSIIFSNKVTKWKKGNVSLAEVPASEAEVNFKPKMSLEAIGLEEVESLLVETYEYINEKLNVDAEIEIDLQFKDWMEQFVSSEGTKIIQQYPYTVCVVTGRVRKNNHKIRYFTTFGGLGGIETLPLKDKERHALDEFCEIINNIPNAKALKKGRYTALLSEDMAWTLIHECLGHSLEGDNVLSGRSFTAGLLGMKVAPSILSVIDDPYLATVGYYEYDSEGIKGKGTLLIDEGILTDFLHSRETAAAMDSEPSGNYRAPRFDFLPQVRMSNIFAEPKDSSDEELLEIVKNGIFVGDGLGGSAEPQTGEYNLNALYGREIKNGELGRYLIGFQLSGNMLETLSKIIGVGNRLLAKPGSCVKNFQRIYVGSVSPKIALSEARIS